jgi:hypothetical protein
VTSQRNQRAPPDQAALVGQTTCTATRAVRHGPPRKSAALVEHSWNAARAPAVPAAGTTSASAAVPTWKVSETCSSVQSTGR